LSEAQSPQDARPVSTFGSWQRYAWVPVPVLVGVLVVLWTLHLPHAYNAPVLLAVLNIVFSTCVSLFIAGLAAHSFLRSGRPGLLWLTAGVFIWGWASLVAVISFGQTANFTVTIHNVGVGLAAGCHLAGALLAARGAPVLVRRGWWLAGAFTVGFGAVLLTVLGEVADWLPVFFVQGQGGTPLRQLVLTSAVAMLALTAAVMLRMQRRAPTTFAYWYALGLALLAAGVAGVMVQSLFGGVLGWTARGVQYLGGVYMLIAALASLRETGAWEIALATQLQAARQRYEELFDLVADGLVVHELVSGTAPGRFERVNPAICQMLRYTAAELKQLSPLDIIVPGELLSVPGDTAAMARDPVFRHEKTLLAKDSRRLAAEITTRQFEQDGRAMVVSVIRDVTARKQAEGALWESEERFRLFMNHSPTIAWIKDEQGRHVYLSETYEKRFGVRLEDWRGKTDAELWPPEFAATFRRNDRAVLDAGHAVEMGEETVNPDGSRCYWLNSKFPFTDAAGNRYVAGIGLDITARKQGEEQIQRHVAELERFNRAMVGRELRMVELKREINELCRQAGLPERYRVDAADEAWGEPHAKARRREEGRDEEETRGHGDAGTRGDAAAETRGHGDAGTRGGAESPRHPISASPCPSTPRPSEPGSSKGKL